MSLDSLHISTLPGYARWFVGIVTSLMLLVTLWVMFIYIAEKGEIDTSNLPAYLSDQQEARIKEHQAKNEPDNLSERSNADNDLTGNDRIYDPDGKSHWRRNLGMAHTHINGQTLLFFALGSLFLFTSVPARRKRLVFLLFASAIVLHAIGLSGEGFYPIFEDILAISGLTILLMMLYMAMMIYVDLGRSRKQTNS